MGNGIGNLNEKKSEKESVEFSSDSGMQYSKYLPIWKQLKLERECRITAPPIFHKRIVKAVKKRRDKDTLFLYQLAEVGMKHEIKYKIEGTVIHFRLHIYLTVNGL